MTDIWYSKIFMKQKKGHVIVTKPESLKETDSKIPVNWVSFS